MESSIVKFRRAGSDDVNFRINGMPIFEYQCKACASQFELLVGVREQPACPQCDSSELDKLMSAANGRVTSPSLPLAGGCPPPEAGPCSPSCCRLPQ